MGKITQLRLLSVREVLDLPDRYTRVPRRTSVPGEITWPVLVSIEPRLAQLEADVIAAARSRRNKFSVWYGTVRPRIAALVGWDCPAQGDGVLDTCEAYDVVSEHLMNALRHSPRRRRSHA